MGTINKWMMAAVAASLLASARAGAGTIIVDNLTTNAGSISGVKNAAGVSYAQGFEPLTNGILSRLTMDLGLLSDNGGVSPVSSSETMSIYLYAANASGAPTTELATLATGLTVSEVEGCAYVGYTGNNTSDIYQYAVNLLSTPSLTGDDYYAIEIDLSAGPQAIGWAEETGGDPEPTGEIGELDPIDGYGRMDLETSVPEPSPLLLAGLGAGLLLLRHRRQS